MRAEGGRRQRLLRLAAGAAFLAVVGLAVLIVLSAGGGAGGDAKIEGGRDVERLLDGIPQAGLVLGEPRAPVELVEFGDLQCPFCRRYAEEILPPIIETRVRRGEVKIDFRNYAIIGEQSLPAGAAAIAAGRQGHGWSYLELFYRNQGEENSGYADGEFLRAVAEAAGVARLASWQADRERSTAEVEATSAEARSLGFDGTPSFAVRGPRTEGLEPLGTPGSTEALEEAIEAAR